MMALHATKKRSLRSVNTIVSDTGTHSEDVLENRAKRFEGMGFTSYLADFLAETRIDVWQMQALLDKGCPHDLAVEILIGTMWSGDDPRWGYTEKDLESLYEQAPK